MPVAVVGAGVAGLAVLWHLLERGLEAVLFDPKGIAGGASGISTGLLHPFPGKKALRSWQADEGMEATLKLLQVAENELGTPAALQNGIFRPAVTEQQRADFRLRAEQDPQAQWREISPPGLPPMEGIWIEKGVTIFSRLYLEGLWRACKKRGAVLIQEKFVPRADFEQTVLATGYETLQFPSCRDLPLKATLGQTLLCRTSAPLPFSLVSQGHVTPTENPSLFQVGSTYEHTPLPDPAKALELLPKAALFYPPAKDFEVLEIRSGVRATRIGGYLPIAAKADPKTWVFTGLGSRGMLYHAFLGEAVAAAVAEKRDYLTPNHLHKSLSL